MTRPAKPATSSVPRGVAYTEHERRITNHESRTTGPRTTVLLQLPLDMPVTKFHPYKGLGTFLMGVDVQQAEKRATRRFSLRLPVEINYSGDAGTALPAQTKDVSARGICFYLDAPMAVGSAIEFILTLPPEITLTESIRVRCKGKVVRSDQELSDTKIPVAAVIDEYEFLSESSTAHIAEAGW